MRLQNHTIGASLVLMTQTWVPLSLKAAFESLIWSHLISFQLTAFHVN